MTEKTLKPKTRLGTAELSLGFRDCRVKLDLPRPQGAIPWTFWGWIGMPNDPYDEDATVSLRGEIKDKSDYKAGGRTVQKALVDALDAVAEALMENESAQPKRLVRAMLAEKASVAAVEHRTAAAAARRWQRRPRALKVSPWRY